jgi:uncharacterized metal-binding protein
MAENCCSPDGNVMILACSGGSNVGQLSNRAAVELTQEGFGKMFCLAGIGGHLSGFVQSAKGIPEVVLIDGCDQGCGRAIFTHLDIPLSRYVVITDLGIEKKKDFNLKPNDLDGVKQAVLRVCADNTPCCQFT